jgi:hypothetical protein
MIQPNDCGVFDFHDAECRVFFAQGMKAICEFYILQVEDEWLCAVDCEFKQGDFAGAYEPLSRDRFPHYTRESALLAAITRALRFFHTGPRHHPATPKQVEDSCDLHHKLQEFRATFAVDAAVVPSGTQFSLF